MTDMELHGSLHETAAKDKSMRTPWWAAFLAFLAGAVMAGTGTGGLMALMGDTFSAHGGGWGDLAVMAALIAAVMGLATLPVFLVVRLMMAGLSVHNAAVFLLIWLMGTALAYGTYVAMMMNVSILAPETWRLWLMVGLAPSLLAGLVNHRVEQAFRR